MHIRVNECQLFPVYRLITTQSANSGGAVPQHLSLPIKSCSAIKLTTYPDIDSRLQTHKPRSRASYRTRQVLMPCLEGFALLSDGL